MTRIKLCGLRRECDITWANELKPDYIGFVFAEKSKRYISPQEAGRLKTMLHSRINAVGVFVNEKPEVIAELVKQGMIDMVQLHGSEDEEYINQLRGLIKAPIIQAFQVRTRIDIQMAKESSADMILLDAGAGEGMVFDWSLLEGIKRPYFLAGGLTSENVTVAIEKLQPYGVDVSSALEEGGQKSKKKMQTFVNAVRTRKEEALCQIEMDDLGYMADGTSRKH